MKTLGLLLILSALSATAFAGGSIVPEIDGNSAVSAMALLAGAALVIRSRSKK